MLIPADSAGRLLEICLLFDQHWAQARQQCQNYTLAVLTNVAFNSFEFAKSQLEWMSESVMNIFESTRENAFAFK